MRLYNQQIRNKKMAQRRSWSAEQDKVLKYLKDTLQVKKWSEISRRLDFEYNLPGRNGKQCRERYTNHLDGSIISQEFTSEEQEKLFQLHDKIGNKWSHISKQFTGRTDNHIKNLFHSKLRKAIRKLNKQIKISFKKTVKPYKLSLIYKIVQSSDYRFSERSSFTQEYLDFFNGLKNSLLQYAGAKIQKRELANLKVKEQARLLITRLQNFDKLFKNTKKCQSAVKNQKKSCLAKSSSKTTKKDSTSVSECSANIEAQPFNRQESDSYSAYDDNSFQFVDEMVERNKSSKTINNQTTKIAQGEDFNGIQTGPQTQKVEAKRFYSFLNHQKLYDVKSLYKENILNSLIEQTEFPASTLERKMSIKQFESLRSYENSCLNDSQISMMLRRFDSFSNIEACLFE